MNNFGIVGFGKMGQALLHGMASRINCPITIFDVSPEALARAVDVPHDRVSTASGIDEIVQKCDVVLLAVKPAHAPAVLEKLNAGCGRTILSIVAGLTIARMKALAPDQKVIRIMPNTPALVGAASVVIVDSGFSNAVKSDLDRLFMPTGHVHFVADESQLDAVTGLSGSAPALFAVIANALADAAVAEGLPRQLASALARETMLGTAKLLEAQPSDILKENVMSPGGTTAAGILAADAAGIRSACHQFVCAAARRSRSI